MAFQLHPYRYDVIGEEVDLQKITLADLQNHYRCYYIPNNAVLLAVGDFQEREMLRRIAQVFGGIPAGKPVTSLTPKEPPQHEERRVTVRGQGDTAYLTVAYRVPGATDADYVALTLLNAAFAGGSSLGMFAEGGTNRSSRLYKTLVEGELAAGAGGHLMPTMDPFLYTINAVVRAGCEPHVVEEAVDAEVEQLSASPITRQELDMALRRARAQFIMAGESITGQAHLLGMAEATAGDYHWYESTIEKLNKITLDDLERVSQTYLTKENRTVGWYYPE